MRFDPLAGGPPRESPDPELKVEGASRPSPLMGAYFTSISRPVNTLYLNGLRDYVTRVGDERAPSERPTAYTVSWVEAPIAPPEDTLSTPTSSNQVTRRRLTARP